MSAPRVPREEEQVASQGRAVDQSRWELPQAFKLTDEMLKQCDAEQQRLAQSANSPFGAMSPQDFYRARSVQVAEDLRQTIENLTRERNVALSQKRGKPEQWQAAILALRAQRAERLAAIGRYDLARDVDPRPEHKEQYNRIVEAIWRDDKDTCKCGPRRGSGQYADLEIPTVHLKEEIFSPRHGKVVYLLACADCGWLNAVPQLPDHLREMRAHRALAQATVGHMNPADAARTLTAGGHTSAKLLRRK